MSRHTLGWKDDEICELLCDGAVAGCVDIYKFKECPVCGKRVKLRQISEVIEESP